MHSTETQEIIHNLAELKTETSSTLAALQAKVDGINRRLDVSNGRIATHEEAIQQLRVEKGEIATVLKQLQADRDRTLETQRRLRVAVAERVLWLIGSILLALAVHFAGF